MPSPAPRPPTHRPPSREGVEDGLAYSLWLPGTNDGSSASHPVGHGHRGPWAAGRRVPGMLVLHGAGSRKENHADFARLACANGWAALAFDARGHGASDGEMGAGAVEDVAAMARLLAAEPGVDSQRVVARGSSMGALLALHAAAVASEIAAVIAICPASEDGLRRGLERDDFEMRVGDVGALRGWLGEQDLREAVEIIGPRPLIFLHAEGDEQVPVAWTRELHDHATGPRKLIVAPGGHHRSVQHDPELQAAALRWVERALGP